MFCIKCVNDEHINLREANAVVHDLKWFLRSKSRHRRRLVLLVDSRVVVGAVAKGRSGSQSLNVFLRRIDALCFAGGIEFQVVYIPTDFNPADFPSRGLRIPGRRVAPIPLPKCPSCSLRPHEHPLHVPQRLRGTSLACRQQGKLAYAFADGKWQLDTELRLRHCIAHSDLHAEAKQYLETMRNTRLLEHLDWGAAPSISSSQSGCP